MRRRPTRFPVFIGVTACIILLSCSVYSAGAVKPAVYLLAPAFRAFERYDPLAEEAALRLVAAELAARYGLYARYWAVDQLDQVPDDAYPRIELSCDRVPTMRHLRLTRRGNVFTFFASGDGKIWHYCGCYVTKMPARSCVGLYVNAVPRTDEQVTAVISGARLNGESFEGGHKTTDLGRCYRPGIAEHAGNRWQVRTFGHSAEADLRERGTFIYKDCEGDFDLRAVVERVTPGANWRFAGVMCRAGLDADAATVGTFATDTWQGGGIRELPFTWLQWHSNLGTHVVGVGLRLDPLRAEDVGEVMVSYATWDQLVESAGGLADRILAAVLAETRRGSSAPVKAAPASADQLEMLNQARAAALKVNVGSLSAAARHVDLVLNATPTCPEAHYTASLCGAVTACRYLGGIFHERGRFLGGSLSHWMLARRLAEPQRPADTLAGAWVMLACGYPNAAHASVNTLPTIDQDPAEVKALKMFVTRDYRGLTPETIATASPIEQLAWMWAVQECGRHDLLTDVPQRIALAAKTCALLPLYARAIYVEPAYHQTFLAMKLVMAEDAFELLTCEDIPLARRTTVGRKLAAALGAAQREDIRELAQAIVKAVAGSRSEKHLAAAIGALAELYETAMTLPAGPVAADEGLVWRCVGEHDLAELERGLFLLTLYLRARFMGSTWGDPVHANEFCRLVGEQLSRMPDAADYFKALGLAYLGQGGASRILAKSALEAPLGRRMPAAYTTVVEWPAGSAGTSREPRVWIGHGRGSWVWSRIAGMAARAGNPSSAGIAARMCLNVDDYSAWPAANFMALTGSEVFGERLAARMPYNLAVLDSLASVARRASRSEKAIATYCRMIALAPGGPGAYHQLARLYASLGRRAEAVEVAEQAVAKCKDSAGLNNLMGETAVWLVAEDRAEEALDWGRRAAKKLSLTGLRGLAVALKANGEMRDAYRVYRVLAHRHCTGADEFVTFLCERNYPDGKVLENIDSLLLQHAALKDSAAERIALGFRNAEGKHQLLAKAYAGPLSSVPPAEQKFNLMMCALYSRQFREVVAYARQLDEERPLRIYYLVLACAAAQRSGQAGFMERARPILRRKVSHRALGPVVLHLLGDIPAEAMLERSKTGISRAYAQLILGIAAEGRNDEAAALKAYRAAAAVDMPSTAQRLARRWAAALEAKQEHPDAGGD